MGDAGKPLARTPGGRRSCPPHRWLRPGCVPPAPDGTAGPGAPPQREAPGCDARDIFNSLRFTERFWGLVVAAFWSFVLGFDVLGFFLFLPVLAWWPEIVLMLTKISCL